MKTLAERFRQLKIAVGGNREKQHFEYTHSASKEAINYITAPSPDNMRLIGELEFALQISAENNGKFDSAISDALTFLSQSIKADRVLTASVCKKAEDMLSSLEKTAKEYKLILVAHAHIDMNWMWSYQETVNVILSTFRTMLNIMKEYPQFHFSQSQAAAYKIVEMYDPDMKEEIMQRIQEGRWEVTASSWVECDKNMPDTESLLRQLQYTHEYLKAHWNVENINIDFSPDTFGHNANTPEIDNFGKVKYLYQCRGIEEEYVLYRFRSISGAELLAYREPYWYNGGINPSIASGLPIISRKCAGLKTGLIVYGVGDHGGGPTLRDIERAIDMQNWRIYPQIVFGTMADFFREAETVRNNLPVVNHEENFFSPGCYTTQERIKLGNRKCEMLLKESETMSAMSSQLSDFRYSYPQFTKAWQNVMFTHFHDLITGTCVQDSIEYCMGLYQEASAISGSECKKAIEAICRYINTSSLDIQDGDTYDSRSEGAGAGAGMDNFGFSPDSERGRGGFRIFHIFNTEPSKRQKVVEIKIWDWTESISDVEISDTDGNAIPFQIIDNEPIAFWDHLYFRILVLVTIPSVGYTTIVLNKRDIKSYPVFFQEIRERISLRYCNYILENNYIKAEISYKSGCIISLIDKQTQKSMIKAGKTAGFVLTQTERKTSNAWEIGRPIQSIISDDCVEIEKKMEGELRQAVIVKYNIGSSKAEVRYILDTESKEIEMQISIDWNETADTTVPVLSYFVPLAYNAQKYMYDIPAGSIKRNAFYGDVPSLKYGMAINDNGRSLFMASDCKYGYCGEEDKLSLTLINSTYCPDPYAGRGLHTIKIFLGIYENSAKEIEEHVESLLHPFICQSGTVHKGKLPLTYCLFDFSGDSAVISSISMNESNELFIRCYETEGKASTIKLNFQYEIEYALLTDLYGNVLEQKPQFSGHSVEYSISAGTLSQLAVKFKYNNSQCKQTERIMHNDHSTQDY